MRLGKLLVAIPVIAAVLLTTSCETSNPKRSKIEPPPAAAPPTIVQPVPKPDLVAAAPQKIEPQVDLVEATIKNAEREFLAGQANFSAGHLEAAKENFDKAVNVLMQGPVDVRSDERLQREFDRIVDSVHRLEMAALKEGDGFAEQKSEPAPIDEANDVTFPVDPALKAKAEEDLKQIRSDIPLVINDYVAGYINFFSTRGRGTLIRGWQRAGRYQSMIRRVLSEEGLPQDLIYLAQAESGFHPLALSRVGARGMWQFMHYTAPGYGLQRNWWVDDRQDPEKSTRAAALYLKDLYNQFGDWYLAMAAYNSGAANVQRAVQRTGYADFWELYKRDVLPKETKNYVPIIVAMTIIAKNPEQYGLSESMTEDPEQIDSITVDYAVDLRLVAEAIDVPTDLLADLNPSLLRRITPKDSEFNLKLPAGTQDRYSQAIESIPRDKRVLWRFHKVEAGETLGTLARKYHTSSQAIAEVNSIEDGTIQTDAKLIIPVTSAKQSEAGSYAKKATRYTVRKDDTVLTVADDFGVPADKIRKWNRIKGDTLRKGRILLIYKPVGPSEAASKPTPPSKKGNLARKSARQTHIVKKGETLFGIAEKYGTTAALLEKYNGRIAAKLKPGDVLVIQR